LVQAVDHYSFDIAELWKKFPFIPQWRRDDIMVSYAPKGGSVGKHLTFMMFFLFKDMVIVAGNSAKCVMQALNLYLINL
jgi:hypothetical protein